ncbi:Ribosome control protein 1 [Sesbania bispinosa]|nr:Ribosome control protein 1 [Sesbania bispinosa]
MEFGLNGVLDFLLVQHRVRLGKYKRDSDSLQKEGENLQAVWSPDAKLIAILTSSFYLHIFKVQLLDRRIHIGGKQPSALCLATISLLLTEKVPFAAKNLSVSNIVSDNKHMLLGLSDGTLYSMSWKGEFYGAFQFDPNPPASFDNSQIPPSLENGLSPKSLLKVPILNHIPRNSEIKQLELCLPLRLLFVLYSDGQLVSCSISKKGLKQVDCIKAEKRLACGDAVCASVALEQQILAVGTRRGVVELYDLAESTSLREVSLYDWGYSMDDTGPVSCIAWTPDNSAFAVGWKFRGLTVWSVSGCRLMSTIRQIGLSSVSSPIAKPNHDCKYEPLMGGTSLMQWDEYGYRLYAIEEGSSERILSFSFGKCCLSRGVSGTTYIRQVIYGEDRLLIVQSEETDELKMLHLKLPVSYISQNWPVQHVAASQDGMYLAVAGLHGLILYDIRLKRWRVFGDVTQEQKIQCKGLLWLGKIVVVCNYVDSSNTYELLFYPRYHLDQSSLLCRKPLFAKPMVMDVYQDYILVTYKPFDVHIFHVKLFGELSPSGNPDLQLSAVRELSIMTAKSHPAAMRFIPDQLPRESVSNNYISSSSDSLTREPARCLILRANGELSLLDLDDGRERNLTDSVELFWVTCGQSEDKANLIEDVSWLDYGHRGMQVWYPSPGANSFKQEDFLQLDPELEFDREVYPLGLLPNTGVVVGVSQRMSFSASAEFPCFEPSPQAQTILHCLLRHLLQRDKIEEALRLAELSAEKPHFSHCLEWLLFTVFEADISRLFEECFQRRWYRTAACYILVIAKLEGPAVSQYCALRLLQATLDESLYELAGELVRFLLRSGREYDQASTDSDKMSPRFLGSSFKEQSAHVTSVKNILENHASYLMSGKELSKLVAFVKGTQFDLVEYLQRERYGSARLESFASGLELISQKLQMGTLQSRLDADFLLAHMCSVKFKEWIVVLATLLRRSEVLFDLFRHDFRLWKAYGTTLQSHPAFTEYQDLLEDLEEKLSSVANVEEK